MPPKRPSSVTVIAALQLGLGSLGMLLGLVALVSAAATRKDPISAAAQARVEQAIDSRLPGALVYVKAEPFLETAAAVLMIVSGFGLLQMERWGLGSGVLWAVLRALLSLLGVALCVMVLLPAVDDLALGAKASQGDIDKVKFPVYVRATVMIAGLVYAVVVLVVLKGRGVETAFAARGARRRPTEPEEDDGEPEERPQPRARDQDAQR
jgi:hypothetical protein